MEQIIINLLKNSAESFLGKKGLIRILAEVHDDQNLIVKISDNGCGISEELCKDPGIAYQTTKMDGNGLGLFVVRTLINDLNGELSIKRLSPGTEISIKLPLYEGTK